MRPCPRCETNNQDMSDFCKKCGYKLSGPTFGLSQYTLRKKDYQGTLKEQAYAQAKEIRRGGPRTGREQSFAFSDQADLVEGKAERGKPKAYRISSPSHLENIFTQKWAVLLGSIILSLTAAVIYCPAMHCIT